MTKKTKHFACFIYKGIGYETALDFARRKSHLILACRSKERGDAARKKIIAESGSENVYVRILDLSSMASVRKFVEEFLQDEDRLDVLVNNAAVSGRWGWVHVCW